MHKTITAFAAALAAAGLAAYGQGTIVLGQTADYSGPQSAPVKV